jgi:hypothetical protein
VYTLKQEVQMTVKHQPAIRLPWTAVANEVIARGNKIDRGIATASGPKEAGDKDAAYIAHACNAYPKLVEELREADARERISKRIPNDFETNISSLLRALGEAA